MSLNWNIFVMYLSEIHLCMKHFNNHWKQVIKTLDTRVGSHSLSVCTIKSNSCQLVSTNMSLELYGFISAPLMTPILVCIDQTLGKVTMKVTIPYGTIKLLAHWLRCTGLNQIPLRVKMLWQIAKFCFMSMQIVSQYTDLFQRRESHILVIVFTMEKWQHVWCRIN